MSEQPKIPKFRVSAAFVSPAALCLIAGTIWFFSLERASEEEVEATVKKEFPQVVRTSHEVDDRMKEFFRRINSNDPREEERMRNLLNKGKGSNYDAKRHHATSKDIEAFGFVPESSLPKAATATTASASSGGASTVAARTQGSSSESSRSGARSKALEEERREEKQKTRRKWWFW